MLLHFKCHLLLLPASRQMVFALNQTLWQHEHGQGQGRPGGARYTTEDLVRHYNCGDLDEILASQDTTQVPSLLNMTVGDRELGTARRIDQYFRDELIFKRNRRMAERIDEQMKEHPDRSFFFAFGAGKNVLYYYCCCLLLLLLLAAAAAAAATTSLLLLQGWI